MMSDLPGVVSVLGKRDEIWFRSSGEVNRSGGVRRMPVCEPGCDSCLIFPGADMAGDKERRSPG